MMSVPARIAVASGTIATIGTIVTIVTALACGDAAAASLSVRVTDRATVPLVDAVVYAMPAVPAANGKPPAPAEIAQARLAFAPVVTVVQVGTSVSFPNRDTVRHQVYSFSPAKVFELRLYAGLPSAPLVFDKPGLVVLGCNIHDRMVAYVMVVDTPWFGKTAADGTVRLDGLPAGDYKVSVWSPWMTGAAVPQAVTLGRDVQVDAVVDVRTAS